VILIVLK